MEIAYKDIHEFRKEDLEDLFLSVDWSSGHFPDKLVVAMRNFQTVYSAWDGDKLIGMVCALDDGMMTAYLLICWFVLNIIIKALVINCWI